MNEPISWGLRTIEGESIPLRALDMLGEVLAGQLRLKHRQRYENRERRPIEAIYVFPVPSDASVIGFVMECGERRLASQLKEREAAFEAYHDATQAGHGAALLERERSNVFTASVGNLLPGQSVSIEIEYIQRLHAEEGALRIVLPTLVAPRYIPGVPQGDRTAHGQAEPTLEVPDADRITPRIGPADYTVSLDLRLHADAALQVSSPSHRLAIAALDHETRVGFAAGRVPLDRDIVVSVEADEGSELSSVSAHKQGDSGYVAVSYVPDLGGERAASPRPNLEVAFVLDRSGSMEGSSIEEALKALRLCLRQLCEGDRFSIVTFSDELAAFRPEPVPFSQKSLEEADAWLASTRARGGTELLAPLLSALDRVRSVEPARESCVVLLTDGQVGNEEHILEEVLARGALARVYTFGIGSNVSDALLLQLARKTGGAAEFIHPGERIDEKVVATFSRAIAPRVRDLRAEWSELQVHDLAPADPPPLVDGEPWLWAGRYKQPGSGALSLRGTLRGEAWSQRIPVTLPAAAQSPLLPQLWAAERIRDLEGAQLGGASLEARISALALEYGLASRYTSFVVVETRDASHRSKDAGLARPIPVHAPAGWAMFEPSAPPAGLVQGGVIALSALIHQAALKGMPLGARAAPPMRARMALDPGDSAPRFMASAAAQGAPMSVRPSSPPSASNLSFGRERSEADPAYAILSRQLASGLWDDAPGQVSEEAERSRLQSSVRSLIELLRLGVNSSHPQYGVLIRKAVIELLPLAAALAGSLPAMAEQALTAAWLISTGRRTRRAVRDAVRSCGLSVLEARLEDDAALRARLLNT